MRHIKRTGTGRLEVFAVEGLPEFATGMRVGEQIAARAELRDGDVVVVSQKVVSKAEGRVRALSSVTPGAEARRLAAELGKDPALVELILAESREVLRAERGVLIVETRHGLVCANAGIDSSNLPAAGTVSLLPEDPDASARQIRAEIRTTNSDPAAGADPGSSVDVRTRVGADSSAQGPPPAVIVADSFGRAWRLGQVEVAIGCAGIAPLEDWRGRLDAEGRKLEATLIAVADQAAAAADLVRDKTSRVPAAIVRGLQRHVTEEDGPGAQAIRRLPNEDLFR
ncbi:MAG: coenzyme F420-0:L-glutamate ligase [Solirubrobacterales bacterium]